MGAEFSFVFPLGEAVTCPIFSISHDWGELVHKGFTGWEAAEGWNCEVFPGEGTSAVTEPCFPRNRGRKGQAGAGRV